MTFMKIRGIKKSFNERQIINKAEFDIKHGSRIGLVGNNGAGKTTLANIIHGSVLPDAGVIETFNGSVNIGYLKQSTEYSVLEFEDAISLAEKGLFTLSSKLGLSKNIDWGDTPWENLSGGEKLKLSLASVGRAGLNFSYLMSRQTTLTYRVLHG